MKKLLGLLVIGAGIFYFTKKTEETVTTPSIIPPADAAKSEVQKYEGKIVVDSEGIWSYVLNGILRPLSKTGLDELNARGVQTLYLTTPFWNKYIQFTGQLY